MKKVMFAMAATVGGIMMISCSNDCTCTGKYGENEVKVSYSEKQLQEKGITCSQMQAVMELQATGTDISYTCKQ